MGDLTYVLFNIYCCIKCKTLTHIWHINISSLSVGLSVPTIENWDISLLIFLIN